MRGDLNAPQASLAFTVQEVHAGGIGLHRQKQFMKKHDTDGVLRYRVFI